MMYLNYIKFWNSVKEKWACTLYQPNWTTNYIHMHHSQLRKRCSKNVLLTFQLSYIKVISEYKNVQFLENVLKRFFFFFLVLWTLEKHFIIILQTLLKCSPNISTLKYVVVKRFRKKLHGRCYKWRLPENIIKD